MFTFSANDWKVSYSIKWKNLQFPEIYNLWKNTKKLWLEDIVKTKSNFGFSFQWKDLQDKVKIWVWYNLYENKQYTVYLLNRFNVTFIWKNIETKEKLLEFLKSYIKNNHSEFDLKKEEKTIIKDIKLWNNLENFENQNNEIDKQKFKRNWSSHVKEYFDEEEIKFKDKIKKLNLFELNEIKEDLTNQLLEFKSISNFSTWIVSPLNHMLSNKWVFSWAAFADLEIEQNKREKQFLKNKLFIVNEQIINKKNT